MTQQARGATIAAERTRQPAGSARRPLPARPDWPGRQDRPASPVRPAGPGRTARLARTGSRPAGTGQAGTGQAGTGQAGTGQAAWDLAGRAGAPRRPRLTGPAGDRLSPRDDRPDGRPAGHHSRTSFVLLLLGLLGASLGCLLVVNTTLAANSITINDLQQANQTGMQQVQEMRQQVAAAGSAAEIEKAAMRLHMRPDGQLQIVDLGTGKIIVPGPSAMLHSAPGTGAERRTGARRVSGPPASGHHQR